MNRRTNESHINHASATQENGNGVHCVKWSLNKRE